MAKGARNPNGNVFAFTHLLSADWGKVPSSVVWRSAASLS